MVLFNKSSTKTFLKNRTNLEHSMKFPQFFIGKFQKRIVFVLYITKITKFVLLKNVIQKLSHYHNLEIQ